MMFFATVPLVLAALTSASASLVPRPHAHPAHLARQAPDPRIPSACTTPCTPSFPLYDACLYKQPGCEAVCWPDNWANFVACQQCLLSNSDHVIKGQVDSANNVIRQLAEDCATNGTTVVGTSVSATTAAISTAPRPSATEIKPQNNNFAASNPQPSSGATGLSPGGAAVGVAAMLVGAILA